MGNKKSGNRSGQTMQEEMMIMLPKRSYKVPKCAICKKNDRVYLWQPCGPADDFNCFQFPGWQYRGFPCVACCDDCRKAIQENKTRLIFIFKKQQFAFENGKITKVTDGH